ncbi:DUF6801 domain-containing protein [Streptomyces sp. NPDC023723]|uniref:DUF6801 domain-containing protein n=1 Tax=Streptomyces sp. NPDC023723 TaxID=3154323 RepID=UPI0033BFBD48
MPGPRRPPRSAARRRAAIAAFVVLAATVPTVAVAGGTQQVDAALSYACALPSGEYPVPVRIAADFPDQVAAGEPVLPADVTTTVELPEQAVADLTALGAAEVRAATRLGVGVAQGEAGAEATWRGTAEPVAVPAAGPLTLTATGDVPSVTGQGDSDLVFSAGQLSLDLAATAADGTAVDPLTVDCSLGADAPGDGLLATVAVGSGPSGSPSPSGTPSGSASPSGDATDGPGGEQGERAPKVAEEAPGDAAADRTAPPCRYTEEYPSGPMSLSAYITGYSNVRKLDGAALLPIMCTLIEQGQSDFALSPDFTKGIITQHSEGRLDYQGAARSAPFEATFLTFGFTPTKATMVLEQTGPLTLDAYGEMSLATFYTTMDTHIRVPLVLRITSLEVNGVPLDVGDDCRTSSSLTSADPDPAQHPGDHLVLHGRGEYANAELPTGYILLSGGPLTGEMTIPSFTGCGAHGEDLDPLLTASVSGPGNYVKQMQGQTCGQAAPNFESECTPDLQPLKIPVPER